MASLGVNIDHIANIREARRTVEPDPVPMAMLAELGGADGITVHLREDRRHIQDRGWVPTMLQNTNSTCRVPCWIDGQEKMGEKTKKNIYIYICMY